MKTFKYILIYIIVTSLVTGCNQRDADQYEFVVFAHHENMNDELRSSLFKCLNTEKVEYQVDDDKNVLVKKKDVDHAVMSCS